MPCQLSNKHFTIGIVLLSLASIAQGQQPITRLPESLTQSTTIDSVAEKEVATFIAKSMTNLASDDPTTVRNGREMIVQSLSKQSVNPAFRTIFASKVLPGLRKTIADGSAFQATNALEVVKALQSPDAIAFLSEQSSPKKQPNASLRLVAASGLSSLRTPIDLTVAQADGILKMIGASAAQESDWMIASYDLQALQAFSTSPHVPKASQGTARTLLISSLESMVDRLRKASASTPAGELELIRAVNRSLATYMRDQVPLATPADAASLAKALEPTLRNIKLLASDPPPSSNVDAYKQAGKTAEKMLVALVPGNSPKPQGKPQGKPAARK